MRRNCGIAVATVALSAVTAAHAAPPGGLPAKPRVRFDAAAECPQPTPPLARGTLLTGRFRTTEHDTALVLNERSGAHYSLNDDGCFEGDSNFALPEPPRLTGVGRARDGTDRAYLLTANELLQWDGAVGQFVPLRPPDRVAEVEWIGSPRAHVATVELVARYRDGRWASATEEDGKLRWQPFSVGTYLRQGPPQWSGTRLFFLASTDRVSSSVYALDVTKAQPQPTPLKRIAYVEPEMFEIAGRTTQEPLLWASRDSSLWAFSSEPESGALTLSGQLPDIAHWAPLVNGDFLCNGASQLLAIPRNSSTWWLYTDRKELTATTHAVPSNASVAAGAFVPGPCDQLVVLDGGLKRLRAKALAPPEPAASNSPVRCEGVIYLPGVQGRWSRSCPSGHAVFGTDDSGYLAVRSYFNVDCCPLPRSDVLGEDVPGEFARCPENAVVTSGPVISESHMLRCTSINPRYILGPPRPGVYWGEGLSVPRDGAGIERKAIPEALRIGIGRESRTVWDLDGCIGDPPGSLLTEVNGGDCSTTRYRQLLYAGRPGDPARGTPVPTYPESPQR